MVSRQAVLDKARAWLGTTERTGNNDVVFADEWGITGSAWCVAFLQSCFYYAGAPLPHQSMYVPFVVQWARDHGQAIEVDEADRVLPGDIVAFSWDMNEWPRDRPGTGDHVGIVERFDGGDSIETIEGNVGASIGKPDGVWRFTRSISRHVVCFWRPPVYDDSPLLAPAEVDDMFSDADRALLNQAGQRTEDLSQRVLRIDQRVEIIWVDVVNKLGRVDDRVAVIWPQVVDLYNRFTQLEERLAQQPAEPAQPGGPLPPVARPDDLELRVASLERRLDEILSLLKPAA